MRVLDLFCGEGGAGYGYHLAGATVVGIDLDPQRRYPFQFFSCSALSLRVEFLRLFDLIHASPPCQFGSEMRHAPGARDKRHENLIPATRAMLQDAGVPYVIENVRAVARAGHLIAPVALDGRMFGNRMTTSTGETFWLSRERFFETSWGMIPPAAWQSAAGPIANVFGGHLRCRSGEHRTGGDTGRTREFVGEDKPALARALMGMPWATMRGMSEAVPPSYTAFIGAQFASIVGQRAAA